MLDLEKVGHENADRQRLQAELEGRYSLREVQILYGLVEEGLAEINKLEDEVKKASDTLNHVKALSAERSTEHSLMMAVKNRQLLTNEQDSARKDAELAQVHADLMRNRADLEEKSVEIARVKEDSARKNTDFVKRITSLESEKADFIQRTANLTLSLMCQKHRGQGVARWLPLINSPQPPAPATQPAIDQHRWWTIVPSPKHQTNPTPALPRGILESIALLYGEAITNQYDEDGPDALRTIIRYLEVAEVAPIAMMMELLRHLLTNTMQDFDSHKT